MKLRKALILGLFIFPFLLTGQSVQQKSKVDSMVNVAKGHRIAYEFEKALSSANLALEEAIKTGYVKGEADSYVQIGRAEKGLQLFAISLRAYRKAFHLRLNALADTCGAANVKNNMVSVWTDSFEISGTKNNLKLGLKISNEAENLLFGKAECNKVLTRIYINRANTYELIDSLEKAILHNRKAAALFEITRDTTAFLYGQYGLAKRYIGIEKFDSARLALNISLKLMSYYSEPDSFFIGQLYESLGVIELNSGAPEKALKYFGLARKFLEQFPEEASALTYIYFNVARSHEKMENFIEAKKAYELAKQTQAKESKSSPFYDMLSTQVALMDAEEQKRKEEKRSQQITNALLLALLILAGVLIWLFNKERALKGLQKKHYQLKHDIIKNELRTIENHLSVDLPKLSNNPIAYSLILRTKRRIKRILLQIGYEESSDIIPSKLKAFVQDMHQSAEETALMVVQNYSYLDEVEDYSLSETLRFNLSAILVEAFTNIHKYSNCKNASINFSVDENGLTIFIQDDGDGCDLNKINRSGLNNISQRVRILNGTVFFESALEKGFKIKIVIPRFPENH